MGEEARVLPLLTDEQRAFLSTGADTADEQVMGFDAWDAMPERLFVMEGRDALWFAHSRATLRPDDTWDFAFTFNETGLACRAAIAVASESQ